MIAAVVLVGEESNTIITNLIEALGGSVRSPSERPIYRVQQTTTAVYEQSVLVDY